MEICPSALIFIILYDDKELSGELSTWNAYAKARDEFRVEIIKIKKIKPHFRIWYYACRDP